MRGLMLEFLTGMHLLLEFSWWAWLYGGLGGFGLFGGLELRLQDKR